MSGLELLPFRSPTGRTQRNAWQLVRYLAVGASTNVFVVVIYYGASLGAGLHHKLSLTLASGVGFLVSYLVNRAWVFRSAERGMAPLVRYGAGYLCSFGIQWGILHVGVDVLGYPHQWVVLFGLGCATLIFYTVQRLWVFGGGDLGRDRKGTP